MSITLTYNQLYEHFNDDYFLTAQEEIEHEVMQRLIGGDKHSKSCIINHTNIDMFTSKDLKRIYEIVQKFIKKHSIDNLDFYNLMDFLADKDILYTEYIEGLNRWFITNIGCENWVIRLQNAYKKRKEKECSSISEFKELENTLKNLKILDTEIKPLDVAVQYMNDYENKSSSLIKTGYSNIDNLIGGLQGGNLLVLAGATGMGKTAMALNLIIKIAEQGKQILLFSLEMKPDELMNRIIAAEENINAERLRNRDLTTDELNKYYNYLDSKKAEIINKNLVIHNKASVRISDVEEIVNKSSSDIVFIDYLGLIKGENKANTYEEISDISRRLKLLANDTNKPIILLHQLNRDNKNRTDKHPTLSDIRDSGKIEQDADTICFVYRPSYYDTTKDKRLFEFIVAKSRHTGGAGKIATLLFNGDYQQIREPIRYV